MGRAKPKWTPVLKLVVVINIECGVLMSSVEA